MYLICFFFNLLMTYNTIYVFRLQLIELCQLVLNITVTTSSSVHATSTLKCSYIFIRNTVAIERNLLGEMAKESKFVKSFIDEFVRGKIKNLICLHGNLKYNIVKCKYNLCNARS